MDTLSIKQSYIQNYYDFWSRINSQMQQVLCIHGGNTNCVVLLLKQLSLSLLGVIQSLRLTGVLLKTHFGYVLTMGYDCFILLCSMLWKNYDNAFLHQGTRQTRELLEL